MDNNIILPKSVENPFNEGKGTTTKKKNKGTLLIVLGVAIVVIMASFFIQSTPKKFETEGMTITLTNEFVEDATIVSFFTTFTANKVAVMVNKEDYESLSVVGVTAKSTVSDYATAVMSAYSLTSEIKASGKLTHFDYTKNISGTDFTYRFFAFKTDTHMWGIQFVAKTSVIKSQEGNITKWANSITFN